MLDIHNYSKHKNDKELYVQCKVQKIHNILPSVFLSASMQ